MDPRGNVAGYIFLTRELAPEVLGYGGHIPMAVRTDPAGQIQSIQLLPNNETPAYVRRLDIIVQKLVGQRPGDELPPASKVDAIAGATVSSQAVALTIRKSLAVFAGKVLAAPATSIAPASRVAWHKLLFPILVFLLVLAAILSARRELHWFAMAAGFVYFGIMTAGMLSIVQVANLGLLNIPDFAANPSWWLTIVFAFLSALVIGRAHCAAACPFALVQEALHILLRRRLPAPGVTPALDRRARYLKYFFLLTLLAATFILGNTSAANIEPFVTLFCG
ncbi:MAG: FMN-binding protein, partial [Candidatus Omnitrophica bacterium]|nr:FMN-binding protein [Candidatus Omnitrophota bacterium]